jgi:hypothetical protein
VKAILRLLTAFTLGPLGLCACRPAAAPAPDMSPAATVLPATRTVLSPTPSLATPEPEPDAAWTEHRAGDVVIRLPDHWQVEEQGSGRAGASLSAFEQDNPELAGFLGRRGSPMEVVLSARDLSRRERETSPSSVAGEFVDNLNIRHTASDGLSGAELPEIAATIAAQYRQLDFDVTEIATGIEAGDLPAARIVYDFSMTGQDGAIRALTGLQLLVAAPDDLWILTYTTTGERFAALRPVLEESARSFEVR